VKLLVLSSLLVAGCAASQPAIPQDFRQFLEELQPAMVRELGSSAELDLPVYWKPDLKALIATIFINEQPRYLVIRADWTRLSPDIKRLSVAHELGHAYGPCLQSFALMEGLADSLAIRIDPEMADHVWIEHWACLAKAQAAGQAPGPEGLLKQTPSSPEEDKALRALGFLTLSVMPDSQLLELEQGIRTPEQVLADRSWETTLDLLRLADSTRQGP
jgi:hypothetical protein